DDDVVTDARVDVVDGHEVPRRQRWLVDAVRAHDEQLHAAEARVLACPPHLPHDAAENHWPLQTAPRPGRTSGVCIWSTLPVASSLSGAVSPIVTSRTREPRATITRSPGPASSASRATTRRAPG